MHAMTKDRDAPKRFKSEVHRRQHRKNLALLAVLVAFIVLVYFISIARMSGG